MFQICRHRSRQAGVASCLGFANLPVLAGDESLTSITIPRIWIRLPTSCSSALGVCSATAAAMVADTPHCSSEHCDEAWDDEAGLLRLRIKIDDSENDTYTSLKSSVSSCRPSKYIGQMFCNSEYISCDSKSAKLHAGSENETRPKIWPGCGRQRREHHYATSLRRNLPGKNQNRASIGHNPCWSSLRSIPGIQYSKTCLLSLA